MITASYQISLLNCDSYKFDHLGNPLANTTHQAD